MNVFVKYWSRSLIMSLCNIFVVLCFIFPALAKENKASTRQKVIDFEGDLVEGVNKRPLDSLSEISDTQKRKNNIHLYRKRKGFRTENKETLREMRYLE